MQQPPDRQTEDFYQAEMQRRALQRSKRLWIFLAFIPAPIFVPIAIALILRAAFGSLSGSSTASDVMNLITLAGVAVVVLSMLWIFRCACKIAKASHPSRSEDDVIAAGCGLGILLLLCNIVVAAALLFGTCTVIGIMGK
jgi:hypothetical protein